MDSIAAAQNDIEFKQLRNNVNIGDDITQNDVTKYLTKAHELNDEVDSDISFVDTLNSISTLEYFSKDYDNFKCNQISSTNPNRFKNSRRQTSYDSN
jgi:hypothetical protein